MKAGPIIDEDGKTILVIHEHLGRPDDTVPQRGRYQSDWQFLPAAEMLLAERLGCTEEEAREYIKLAAADGKIPTRGPNGNHPSELWRSAAVSATGSVLFMSELIGSPWVEIFIPALDQVWPPTSASEQTQELPSTPPPTTVHHSGGPKPALFWRGAKEAAQKWLDDNGCPAEGDGQQANLERFIAEWIGDENRGGSLPNVRRHVSRWIQERRAAQSDHNNRF
jgi:hypothetical protein